MNIEQLISPVVPVLSLEDTGTKALQLMEETGLAHLPLVADEQYLALVAESSLLDWETPDLPLKDAGFLNYKPVVMAVAHPYDALRTTHQHNLTVLPVVDNGNHYLGSITRDDLLKYIAENSSLDTPGAIVVLEMDPRNYTLYEIARVFENEDVVVLGTQLYTNPVNGNLEVTIKTNRTDLQAVISSLERHEYRVKQVYGEVAHEEDVQSRYNLLMNYINM
ncbi:MAG: CBS domain-containing protein [Taibaiella sp.]|nr:CBS domain-containing protein [Taibaiella sp.]